MAKHKFWYGFKSYTERLAEEIREEMSLAANDPLCPKALARHLEIPVFPLSKSEVIPNEMRNDWLSCTDCPVSAFILADGSYKEIYYNDHRHPRRQNSDIAHELAHALLGHDMTVPLNNKFERIYPKNEEEEAKWLGATLLLPKTVLIHIEKNNVDSTLIQQHFGVSLDLYKYRYGVTDMKGFARNYRRKRNI